MTDLENKEAFEKWFKKSMYHKHLKENFWDAWQASAQREGFKLMPLEPTKEMIDCVYCEDGNYIDSIDGSPETFYKAMINAV